MGGLGSLPLSHDSGAYINSHCICTIRCCIVLLVPLGSSGEGGNGVGR